MTAEATFQEAVALHRAGDIARAEPLYRSVLEQDFSHDRACFLLGSLLHEGGQHQEGLTLMKRAAALEPVTVAYHTALSEVYRRSGDAARALGELEEATYLNPQAPGSQLAFARALSEGARPADATGHWQCAALLLRDASEPRQRLAALWTELAERRTGESNLYGAQRVATARGTAREVTVRATRAVEHAFALALQHHQAGRLKVAEQHKCAARS